MTCSINKASPDPNRIIFAMQDTLCVESHMPLNFGQSLHHVIFLPSQTFDKGLYLFIYLFIYLSTKIFQFLEGPPQQNYITACP